eukprot:GILI01000478.1.p1 GENE.GILI01000478.1~~GILI01000478.1.p1  ORF type:complete len:479 (-),score=119.38 GILI01000478.1:215-1579(-)
MGPAMVVFPYVFQRAGWFTPVVALCTLCIIASFCSTMLCEAIRMIPGNDKYQKRYEFSAAVQYYFGDNALSHICRLMFIVTLQAFNVVSIIVGAVVMDNFICFCIGKTFALQYAPTFEIISAELTEGIEPFNGNLWSISLGFILSLIICIPLGFLNLEGKENMYMQYFSFVVLLGTTIEFLAHFGWVGLHPQYTPMFGETHNKVLGTAMFSYAFVVSMPSWVNEKRPDVNLNLAIWPSTIAGLVIKLSFGLMGAWAFYHLHNDNVLDLMDTPHTPLVTKLCVYLFNVGTIIPGIPPMSIVIRYNLIVDKICSARWAAFWGVVAPWLVAMFLCHGRGFIYVVNWSALLATGFVNFVVPPAIYIIAYNAREREEKASMKRLESGEKSRLINSEVSGVSLEESNSIILPNWMAKFTNARVIAYTIAVFMTCLIFTSIGIAFWWLFVKRIDIVGDSTH